MPAPRTHIATSDATSITVRGKDLTRDLMDKRTFTEMVYFLTCGKMPTAAQTKVLDACLVTLMEHGWTPTSIITRLALDSVPDQTQLAMAAGLLSIGSVFVGTMEGCAEILSSGIAAGGDLDAYCRDVTERHRAAAVVSRAGGLLGHVVEEKQNDAAREIWKLTRENIAYEDPDY